MAHAFDPPLLVPAAVVLQPDGVESALVPTVEGGPVGWQAAAKRLVDIVGALVLLTVALPLIAVGALGTKLTSSGPVLFRQVRVGRGGQRFVMLKLRTFPVEHVDRLESVPHEACPSRWGRLLRRSSIDELPQLWNVLRGDMSLVGPRPERPHAANVLAGVLPEYRERHRAPAGITGLAQVRGLCGPTSIVDRVRADNEYVEGWTLWRDIRLLLLTIPTVVRKIHW